MVPCETIRLMIFGLGFNELLIILLIFLVLFGASKIPQLARGLGKGISEFKKGLREGENEDVMKEIEEGKEKHEDPS